MFGQIITVEDKNASLKDKDSRSTLIWGSVKTKKLSSHGQAVPSIQVAQLRLLSNLTFLNPSLNFL